MVCPFCAGAGTAYEKAFNRADVFKRHLTAVHNVEQTPPNSRKLIITGVARSGGLGAKCSICQGQFATAQEFYEHLDDCVLNVIVPSAPKTAGNGTAATGRKDSTATKTPTSASTDKGKELQAEGLAQKGREASEPRAQNLHPLSGNHLVLRPPHCQQQGRHYSRNCGLLHRQHPHPSSPCQHPDSEPEPQPESVLEANPQPESESELDELESEPEAGLEIQVATKPREEDAMEIEQESDLDDGEDDEEEEEEEEEISDEVHVRLRRSPEVTLGSPVPMDMD